MDFFCDIAILTERGALDKSLVYDEFSYWILYYWEVAQDVVRSERNRDPDSLVALERLRNKLATMEKIDRSPEAVRSFLEEEAQIEE